MKVLSTKANIEQNHLIASYTSSTSVIKQLTNGGIIIDVVDTEYQFKTNMNLPKLGLMMVGWGGNNGTTITGGILANKLNISWEDKKGVHQPNFLGSVTQSSSLKIANTPTEEIFVKFGDILPLIDPRYITLGGWDISKNNLAQSMKRAEVFDFDLQKKLFPLMEKMTPLPSIYYKDFIAANQSQRANNIIKSSGKKEDLQIIRSNIRQFKKNNSLDKVIVLWTANTERFCQIIPGVHDTFLNLMKAITQNHKQISASTIFALACILQNVSFINGSPQNTFIPALLEMDGNGFMVGNDFKTGQTKFKTNFVDFLLSAGIKPKSCISYNHLGNNDGKNLSQQNQFKSKETSKSACINDLLSNSLLYDKKGGIDHTVVIKYLKSTGDAKKAIDEYVSDIFMDGSHTLVSYNVCEDSLLAAGVIIDLIVLTQLFQRITYRCKSDEFKKFDPVLSFLGYLMKAPEVVGPQINSLNRQRLCIENIFRICSGLPIQDNLLLNFRTNVSEKLRSTTE